MSAFRVKVDVSECGVANVNSVWVLVDGRGSEVSWLSGRLRAVLGALPPLQLFLQGALLPADEPLALLRSGDLLSAVPLSDLHHGEPDLEAHKRRALDMLELITGVTPDSLGKKLMAEITEPTSNILQKDVHEANACQNMNVEMGGCGNKRKRVRRRRHPRQPPRLDEVSPNTETDKFSNNDDTNPDISSVQLSVEASHTSIYEDITTPHTKSPHEEVAALDKTIVHNPSPCERLPRRIQSLTCN